MDPRTALVTGASSGIGEAAVRRLLEAGFTVYATARRVDRMADLERAGAVVIGSDVTDDASIEALVGQIVADSGRIDVLVNNAGYGSYGAVEDVPMAEARRQFDVNVFGLARLTQLVLPTMRAQRSGTIINISSIGGKIYEPLGGWYHATKFAVEGLSDSMRLELAPFGIHVSIVEPGAIRTEWTGISADSLEEVSGSTAYADQAAQLSKLFRSTEGNPRLGSDPDVVAKVIAKAATAKRPKTRYLVGQGARPIVWLRRALPDRAFDAVMRTFIRHGSKLG